MKSEIIFSWDFLYFWKNLLFFNFSDINCVLSWSAFVIKSFGLSIIGSFDTKSSTSIKIYIDPSSEELNFAIEDLLNLSILLRSFSIYELCRIFLGLSISGSSYT